MKMYDTRPWWVNKAYHLAGDIIQNICNFKVFTLRFMDVHVYVAHYIYIYICFLGNVNISYEIHLQVRRSWCHSKTPKSYWPEHASRGMEYSQKSIYPRLRTERSYWSSSHDDVIKWKHFLRYWPFVRRIHRSRWRGALMFSLICTRINGWVNNVEAGDFIRNLAHYYVTVMCHAR